MGVEAVGEIFKVKDGRAIIIAPVSPYLLEKQDIKQCLVRFDDERTIKADQRKKVYAILADITEHTGNMPEQEKELQKYFYIARYGVPYFSLSDCSTSTARDFISYLIDFCFEHNIGTRDTLLSCTDDVSRYLYSCLAQTGSAPCVTQGPKSITAKARGLAWALTAIRLITWVGKPLRCAGSTTIRRTTTNTDFLTSIIFTVLRLTHTW